MVACSRRLGTINNRAFIGSRFSSLPRMPNGNCHAAARPAQSLEILWGAPGPGSYAATSTLRKEFHTAADQGDQVVRVAEGPDKPLWRYILQRQNISLNHVLHAVQERAYLDNPFFALHNDLKHPARCIESSMFGRRCFVRSSIFVVDKHFLRLHLLRSRCCQGTTSRKTRTAKVSM